MQLLSESKDRIHRWDAKSAVTSKPRYPWAATEPAVTYYLVDAESQPALLSNGNLRSRGAIVGGTDVSEHPSTVWVVRSREDEALVADDLRLRLDAGQGVQVVDLRRP